MRRPSKRLLATPLPAAVARGAVIAPRWWSSLAILLLRRVPQSPHAYSYHRRSARALGVAAAAGAMLAIAAIVVAALHPSAGRELAAAALALLAVTMGGAWAAPAVHPHRIERDAVVLRHGASAVARVPLDDIVEVVEEPRRPSVVRHSGIRVSHNGGAVAIAVRGWTDVTFRLRRGVVVHGVLEATPAVRTLRAAADDPAAFIDAVRARVVRAVPGATSDARASTSREPSPRRGAARGR
ncbi:MAG TPA: hypothetical protein VF041_00670 [Gemmatimonadaceae bacterium]